jgi:hypothetical protein
MRPASAGRTTRRVGEPVDGWTPDELRTLSATRELEVGTRPDNGVPIWVVVVGDRVLVRTWRRRTTGWYGRAVRAARLRVRVGAGSVEAEVSLVGTDDADAVDAAYRAKYGTGGAESMVTAEAIASTLRLTPARAKA